MIELRDFAAADDDRSRSWERTVRQHYHGGDPDAARLAWLIDAYRRDGAVLTGLYDDEPGVDGQSAPVGTFAAIPGTMNLGGRRVAASLIASVGVRPTHRRRGLLRRMMEHSLQASVDAGVPLAILTASEGGIYERFGFGAAVWSAPIRIDTRAGLRLRSAGSGSVRQVEPQWMAERAPAVFERFHVQTFGSVGRRSDYLGDQLFDPSGDRISPLVRAVAHLNGAGEVDGYAFYRPQAEYSHRLEVRDLVALTDDAYVSLWNLLGNLDLVESVAFDQAALDEPIRHAVVDPRAVEVTGVRDALWVRVLDPVAALASRGYRQVVSDTLVLQIDDDLGYAAGRFEVRVEGGRADVRRVDAVSHDGGIDATLDVAGLGVLLLGSVTATELAAAARIRLIDRAAGERLDAAFSPPRPPRFSSQF